jgi:hypothetical protein
MHSLPAIVSLLLLLLCGASHAGPVVCTVPGQFSSIQAGLNGCNGGAGSIQLTISPGTYTEQLTVPMAVGNLTLASTTFLAGNIPPQPTAFNLTVFVVGVNHSVQFSETSLFFQGIAFNGESLGQPFFESRLINNNFTLDRCLVANFTGNYTMQGEGCIRGVTLTVINSRFANNWGSHLYFEGMENFDIENNIFGPGGGLNNYSSVYTKLVGLWDKTMTMLISVRAS